MNSHLHLTPILLLTWPGVSFAQDVGILLPVSAGIIALLALTIICITRYYAQQRHLRQLEAERSVLDQRIRELQYLYRLRTTLSSSRSLEESIRLVGKLLSETLQPLGGGEVFIEYEEHSWKSDNVHLPEPIFQLPVITR